MSTMHTILLEPSEVETLRVAVSVTRSVAAEEILEGMRDVAKAAAAGGKLTRLAEKLHYVVNPPDPGVMARLDRLINDAKSSPFDRTKLSLTNANLIDMLEQVRGK